MLNKEEKNFFKKLLPLFDGEDLLMPLFKLDDIGKTPSENRDYIKSLEKEGYLDVIYTDKRGVPFIYLNLKKKGKEFISKKKTTKNEIAFRVLLALVSAVATFLFGKLIYALFS